MTIIEIEDYNGNTIGYFRIKNTKEENIIDMLNDFEIADVESDYLCNTDEPLIRVQSTFKEWRFWKMKKCERCKIDKAEVETDRGIFLCSSCDSERLSRINNTENPKTEDDFYKEIK